MLFHGIMFSMTVCFISHYVGEWGARLPISPWDFRPWTLDREVIINNH